MRLRPLGVLLLTTAVTAGFSSAQGPPPTLPVPPAPAAGQPTPGAAPQAAPAPTGPPHMWEDVMKDYYAVVPVPKSHATRFPDGTIKINIGQTPLEVVSEDEENYYARALPIEDPRSGGHSAWLMHERREAGDTWWAEYLKDKFFLDPEKWVPIAFTRRLHFTDASSGLPASGLWQEGFAVADFDGDGLPDIVLPPSRKGTDTPLIYLNRKDHWELWQGQQYPTDVKFDYGGVAVADFDGDGNLDIVVACHFKPTFVLYGNGKGDFTRYQKLAEEPTARSVAVADFDGDGRPDIALLAELDVQPGTWKDQKTGLLRVFYNTKTGWQMKDITGKKLYGDRLAVLDIDGNGTPDLFAASHESDNMCPIFLNGGANRAWTETCSPDLPYRPFVLGAAGGRFSHGRTDDIVIGTMQSTRPGGEKAVGNALIVYRWTKDKDAVGGGRRLARTILSEDGTQYAYYGAVAVGDIDGDGNLDLVAGRRTGGQLEVYLGDGKGGFIQALAPELNVGDAIVHDIQVVDLNHDGRGEIIVMLSDGKTSKGGIRVFTLDRGGATPRAATKAKR